MGGDILVSPNRGTVQKIVSIIVRFESFHMLNGPARSNLREPKHRKKPVRQATTDATK